MILDQAFDSKGQFTLRAPVRFIRDRILDTEWKKNYAWRPFLDPLIIGLGDQQLITGYAVLLSGWIKVFQNSFEVQGAHFVLVLYICALSSSSHLAALITLRKYFRRYRLIAKIRLTLVIVFACFLLASMIAAIRARPKLERRSKSMTVPANFGIGLFYVLFLNPLVAFIIQLILALLSTILVLSQKFSVPEEAGKWCGLQDEAENEWGFGQTLSVVMLLLPAMSAAQAYLEGRQHIQEGKKP
ncbi:pre-rRNA-processing protein esf1 [Didymosphaeria variabile]|uniref:Pre-rRNA-processing protein esf1 n=1 Tax=Didymosphaeria variabile TaxID=1932322 RepID=A0A9W8XKH6_9PLEO|nr:pre-rRNA-processing protein esf1 [Didymosphaeria variabile]KAJ4351590.1 pre-rRNA-processing protein esf1 [Didymosphaeria variabile]